MTTGIQLKLHLIVREMKTNGPARKTYVGTN